MSPIEFLHAMTWSLGAILLAVFLYGILDDGGYDDIW